MWGMLFVYSIISCVFGGYALRYAPEYANLFVEGPGIFAAIVLGWIPAVEVTAISMAFRYVMFRLKGTRKGNN